MPRILLLALRRITLIRVLARTLVKAVPREVFGIDGVGARRVG